MSDPLDKEVPEIEDYAHVHYLALQKLNINKTHLFGSHTGASIAASIVKIDPKIVDRLFLDSVGLYSSSERSALLKNLCPSGRKQRSLENTCFGHGILSEINGYFGLGLNTKPKIG